MSQTTNNTNSKGIVNSWSLIAFAKNKGPKMQVGTFVNRETSESFKSCIFTNGDGDKTFVAFSQNLGELTPKEIASRKADLQVVELESGHYKLCEQGSTWEDVDLGL